MPTNDMTPQQRAVRVYEMLLEKPRRARDISHELGLGISATYTILNNLSSDGGVPIANEDGWWYFVSGYELPTVFAIYQRLKGSVSNGAPVAQVTVSPAEARIVMAVLERYLPPMP